MAYKSLIAAAGIALAAAAPAHATPLFDTFGDLTQATFGGTGIPNDAVAISTFDINGTTATFGLTATPRFTGTVGNDGAGTFFADPGTAVAGPMMNNASLWNISFYMDLGDNTFDDVQVFLTYDFNPAADNEDNGMAAGLGVLPISAPPQDPSATVIEGSQNLTFSFFENAALFGGVNPVPGTFDANAEGEYFIALSAFATNQPTAVLLGGVAIDVVVGDPAQVSEPATLGLLGLSALGLAGLRRRRS